MGRLIDEIEIYKRLRPKVDNGILDDIMLDIPTVEAIPKADYEARLKADMVAMLTEIQLEIEEKSRIPNNNASAYDWNNGVYACYKVIQQKIDKLKENKNK